jgi:WD40 repeat protein/DNA-binding SARP family transcriptional activator
MSNRYQLRLFGPIQIADGQGTIRIIDSRKGLALLAYLARHDRPLAREHLADLLWGDKSEARGRRNLSRELSEIGAQLPGYLQADYHTVQLAAAEAWVDTAAFQVLSKDVPQAAARDAGGAPDPIAPSDVWFSRHARPGIDPSRLAEAIELYRGEFMAAFYLDGCAEFESWLVREREFWRRTATEALEQLIAYHALHRQDEQAQHYARRWLELEPWQEDAHRYLMLLLARNGKRTAALAQYDACRRALANELGVEPAEETAALYEQIRTNRLQIADYRLQIEPDNLQSIIYNLQLRDWGEAPEIDGFYGREDELATLECWVVDERCRVVAILGMGGMGKTMLASRLARQIAQHYDAVIWRSLLNAPPLVEILRVCILFLSAQQATELPMRLDEQLTLLLDLLRQQRCLLVLDNCESILQGGARAGAYRPGYEDYGQLIQRMGVSAHQSSLLLTSREQPQGFVLLQGNLAPVRSFHLGGLSGDAGQQILRSRGLADLGQGMASLIARYSGNPLALKMVAETVKDLFGGDLAAFLREEALIFDDIRDVLDQQWDRLTALEQDVLLWLTIEREATTPDVLRANLVNGGARQALLEALRSLQRRSQIEPQGAGFTLQNVVMEYATERLIDLVCHELETGQWGRFNTHALIRAQAKEYARESQVWLILAPIAERIVARLGRAAMEQKLRAGLAALREQAPRVPGYAGGNALNLLLHLGYDLRGYDFSELSIWQAQLQAARLPEVNFAHADLTGSVFKNDFRTQDPLAWSPDGVLIAAAAGNGEIHMWQSADQQIAGICAGHRGYIWALAFSPDNRFLASTGADHTVRVWDLQSFQAVYTLRGHVRGVSAVVWSPDGCTLVSSSRDRTIRLWDAHSGRALQTLGGHTDEILCLALSSDGRHLASGGLDRTVQLWDLHSQQVIQTMTHSAWVNTVAFSPDARTLASGCFNGTLWIWDANAGTVVHTLAGSTNQVKCLAFSPDGAALASGGDAMVRIWDPHTGQARATWHSHEPWVAAVAWSPDGARLASLGGNSIKVWDVNAGRTVVTLRGHSDEVLSVAFSPDGTTFASSHADNIIRLWDAASWQVRYTLHGHTSLITNLLFSPDSSTLLSGSFDQTVRLWDIRTGQLRRILRGHTNLLFILALSGDGATLASGSKDETIWIWDMERAQVTHVLRGHTGEVAGLSFSPDGTLLASGAEDGTVRLWDVCTGEALATFQAHNNMIYWLIFDRAGTRVVTASGDETVRVWDAHTGQLLHDLRGHRAVVCELDLSPDGSVLASCGSADQTVRLWNIDSGEPLYTLQHPGWVVSLAFSPDGATLISGSDDGTLRLWDVQSGACLRVLRAPGPYAGMNVTGVMGVTEAQKAVLKALGAVEQ